MKKASFHAGLITLPEILDGFGSGNGGGGGNRTRVRKQSAKNHYMLSPFFCLATRGRKDTPFSPRAWIGVASGTQAGSGSHPVISTPPDQDRHWYR